MMTRIERPAPLQRRPGGERSRKTFGPRGPREDQLEPGLALAYSNGYVSVEISHDALDAYVEMTGNVPLPDVRDPETGDRRSYDARHQVRVVYDSGANLREVSTCSRGGLFVRVNFIDEGDGPPF